MPTYSYKCTECDNAFDIQQAFTDDALTQCPVCGGRIRKVFNSIGVTFNGSGFYRNDSRSTASSTDAPKKDAPNKEPAPAAASSSSSSSAASS
jgi:putative FmdB family regulatory protein